MKRNWQIALVVLTATAAAAYFAHHAVYGRFGLEARLQFLDRYAVASSKLASLEAVRSDLGRDVRLLSPDPPDADLIDELARAMLGFGYPDERVLIEVDSASGARTD